MHLQKKNKDNWVKWWFLLMVVLFIVVMMSCNTVNKSSGKTSEQHQSVIIYDTTKYKVIDTTHFLQELVDFQTKTIELYDTSYHDVPILRQRIIYENIRQQRMEQNNGITKDSNTIANSNTLSYSKTTDTESKKSSRIPFLAIIIGGIVLIVVYGIRKYLS
ncbi:MAG: hypothetical protein EBR82_69185 [Caulobacteraceae bacterium]|nr:hypothetical protein [Caulobacteraceae bacterium]